MAIAKIEIQRFSVTSSRPFREVLGALEAALGHPDPKVFRENVAAAETFAELEKVVHEVLGSSGLMEFARFDFGVVLRKRMEAAPQTVRLVLGNPLIMTRMVMHVPDAGSYVPVTVLIDERQDGVHLSYDKTASFLAPYGNSEALKVARDLDAKIEALLADAAR
ncbi:MAG: DUF302 domain-containing protein [Candidatus Brocadiia bacterium]|jgi:uncharacterized protein (DUF302 family)